MDQGRPLALLRNMDYVGLGFLTIAMGGMQIMLDKGEENDWFSSGFIRFFAVLFVGGMIGLVCVGVAAEEPADQPQALPIQELRHLLLPDDAGGRGAEREHRAAAAVYAATAGLDGDYGRAGADRGRHSRW